MQPRSSAPRQGHRHPAHRKCQRLERELEWGGEPGPQCVLADARDDSSLQVMVSPCYWEGCWQRAILASVWIHWHLETRPWRCHLPSSRHHRPTVPPSHSPTRIHFLASRNFGPIKRGLSLSFPSTETFRGLQSCCRRNLLVVIGYKELHKR